MLLLGLVWMPSSKPHSRDPEGVRNGLIRPDTPKGCQDEERSGP